MREMLFSDSLIILEALASLMLISSNYIMHHVKIAEANLLKQNLKVYLVSASACGHCWA